MCSFEGVATALWRESRKDAEQGKRAGTEQVAVLFLLYDIKYKNIKFKSVEVFWKISDVRHIRY